MTAAENEDRVRRERAQAVGLFRYQLICPALDQQLNARQRGELVRALAARTHTDPFGNPVRVARNTIDRWIRWWRAGGFEALVPAPRQVNVRTDEKVLSMAAALKRENPARTVPQIERILRASTGWSPSQSTLLRHFGRLDLAGPSAGNSSGTTVFGRFEADRCNELWVGDALHGPKVGGRKTFLFAFLDDRSRMVTGSRFGFVEDTVRMAAALQPGLAARGVPEGIYVDNGAPYVDAWLLRGCAKLGIRLVHSAPGRPQGRGKIERFFRTVREQFLVEIADSSAEDLAGVEIDHAAALSLLNRQFTAWVEIEYHRRVHSETGQAPVDRWDEYWERAGHRPITATAEQLTEAFLWSEQRTVTKTATVSLHGNIYEVDPGLTGRKVELVFSPFDLATIEVRYRDRCYGNALPHTITRHSHPKAKPEIDTEPPRPTGIDYLKLLDDTHTEALRRDERIGYHALYGPDDDQLEGQYGLPLDTDTDTDEAALG